MLKLYLLIAVTIVGKALVAFAQEGIEAVAKASSNSPQEWTSDDERNPWAGHITSETSTSNSRFDAVRAFVDRAMQLFNAPEAIAPETLVVMETTLLEHFHALLDLMQVDGDATVVENLADEVLELHASLQDILDLITSERKHEKGTDSHKLSEPFMGLHSKLLQRGYQASTFKKWAQSAEKESNPAAAYGEIAQYLMFEPNAIAYPLTSLNEVNMYLDKAIAVPTYNILKTLSTFAMDSTPEELTLGEETIRNNANSDFIARMVLADRLWTKKWTSEFSNTDEQLCEEVLGYYYKCADDSIQDLLDTGGEQEMEVNLRLSYEWMHPGQANEFFGEVPEDGLEALDYYQTLTQGGDELMSAEAAHRLGEMHFFGDTHAGVAADASAALQYFQRAADSGIPHAQANLGLMYANGLGVPRNATKALKYFELAAKQDNGFAVNGLGFLYWTGGDGIERNATLAVELFERAVKLEFYEAHNYIGAAYLDGAGVEKNTTKAFEHFKLASELTRSRQALFNVGVLYYKGTGVARSCTHALKRFREVAFRKEVLPRFSVRHAFDSYTAGDTTRSLLENLLLAQLGHVDAQVNAAFLLEQRRPSFLEPSKAAALQWYKHAALYANDSESMRKIGQCYDEGWDDLCPKNSTLALDYYKSAGELGDAQAWYLVGYLSWTLDGNWTAAHEAFGKCKSSGFPLNMPCLLPSSILDVWEIITEITTWWKNFHF
uniref:Secreted protein n=1 Tax=Thraustotheca clavata TaxID=74557 RepID=A0A0A7CMB9_9STRA|nr:secreted protein [Thraustotheca clavata]